jgi:hypothetical protein
MTTMKIADIRVGRRIRKAMGDLAGLVPPARPLIDSPATPLDLQHEVTSYVRQ